MKQTFRGSISILIAALLFIGALFVYSDFIKPTYAEIKNKQGEKMEKEEQHAKAKILLEQNQQIIMSFADYQDLYNSILTMMPIEPEVSHAVYQISGMAAASGVAIKGISTAESAITSASSALIGGRGTVKISLRVGGTYESFSSFLDKMQNNIRIFRINTIRVEKSGNSNVLDFNIDASIFYQIVGVK